MNGQEGSGARSLEEVEGDPEQCWKEQRNEWQGSLTSLLLSYLFLCSSPDALQSPPCKMKKMKMRLMTGISINTDANRKKIIGLQRNSGSQICHCRMGTMKEQQKEAEEIKQLFQNNPSLLLTI